MKIQSLLIAMFPMAAFFLISTLGFTSPSNDPCVHIYYDQTEEAQYVGGRSYAATLLHLLKDYSGYKKIVSSIESYKTGDLNKCFANFYIGSYYDNKLPRAFLDDYLSTKNNVVWFGYNIWQMGQSLSDEMGLRFVRMTTLDSHIVNREKKPAYFKDILYKGRLSSKEAFHESVRTPYEQAELVPTDLSKFEMVAETRHSGTRELIPYIVRVKNRFYIADIPFSLKQNKVLSSVLNDVFFEVLGSAPVENNNIVFNKIHGGK
ncbi:hypothetical protein QJS83_15415 [Bdellovibrio sp. 22V]|uniref:hypothetical protein n=1 Tax=Bdellovibrio TaxID=958 RepID=UPI0025427D59|nr:hypothetical protein [Bdellovibrio sp. 22V]WII71852.1 hypothetical protein QJS83_15415 [Bdellovibrio sp. 22V]